MFYVSDIYTNCPQKCENDVRKAAYAALEKLEIPFERVDTDEAITMEDCKKIDEKLRMDMVKTLFLCNRQKTEFYLFVTKGDKPFSSKGFSAALGISRVSFAPAELMEEMLGTKVGAATVFGLLQDSENKIKLVIDKEVTAQKYYGCSDGVTTGYMKILTDDVLKRLIPYTKHEATVTEVK